MNDVLNKKVEYAFEFLSFNFNHFVNETVENISTDATVASARLHLITGW